MKAKIKKIILLILLVVIGLWIIEIIVVKSRIGKSTETDLKQINRIENQK